MVNGVNKHQYISPQENGGIKNMGAQSFYHTIEAYSPQQAFQMLYDDAVYERGNDPYSGTIATCGLGSCQKTFSTYKPENIEEANAIINRLEYGQKWRADFIDLGVVETQEITVKKNVKPYTADYKFLYGVYFSHTDKLVSSRATFKTKGEADNHAIALTLDGKDVQVRRRPVNQKGNDVVSTFEIIQKKTNKRTTKKKNTVIKEKHKYIFFGWAAC